MTTVVTARVVRLPPTVCSVGKAESVHTGKGVTGQGGREAGSSLLIGQVRCFILTC